MKLALVLTLTLVMSIPAFTTSTHPINPFGPIPSLNFGGLIQEIACYDNDLGTRITECVLGSEPCILSPSPVLAKAQIPLQKLLSHNIILDTSTLKGSSN